MKIKLFLIIPLVASALLSCSHKEVSLAAEENGTNEAEGQIQARAEWADTKGNVDAGSGLFTWSDGDQIAVWTEENGYLRGDITSGSGTGTGTFSVPLHGATRSGYAIYPESYALEGSNGTGGAPLAVLLPAVRRIDNAKPDWNNKVEMPMVAVNVPGQDLQFKYTCAMVRLTLKNVPSNTRFIRVMTSRSISGYFAVDTTDPSAPQISSDNVLGGGELSYVVFQFKSNVSGTVTVNLPVPSGVRYNLIVSTHTADIHSSVVDALRPGASDSRGTSRFSIGEQRNFERGKGYPYELDCATGIAYSMDTFSVNDVTVYETESIDVTWSIRRNNNSYDLVTISGLTISSYVEDPIIADVKVIDRERLYYSENASYRPVIRITGLKEGSTKLVTTAVMGDNILTSISNITVKKRGYHIYFRAGDKVLTGGSTPLTAFFRMDGVDQTADSYEWHITEGAELATIADGTDERHKWLKAGEQEGNVTIVCKATYLGKEVNSEPVSIRIKADAPEGCIHGLFTIDDAFSNVFFSKGNLFYDSTTEKYTFFDTQIGYYLHKTKPAGKPNTQEKTDLFLENEIPFNWMPNPMNHSRVYADFDSEEFTTGWFGLTMPEWEYILYSRRGVTLNGKTDARYGRCSVKNENGTNIRCIMLFPDAYIHPDGIPFPGSINLTPDTSGYSRIYTMAEMLTLQEAGVVFLPLTGTHEGGYQYSLSGGLYYTASTGWTSSTVSGAPALGFYSSSGGGINRYTPSSSNYYFYSVRLVRRDW